MDLVQTSTVASLLLSLAASMPVGARTHYPEVPWKLEAKWAVEKAGYFQGDIVVPEGQPLEVNAVTSRKRLWPRGIIPYTVDDLFTYQETIKDIRMWMNMIEYLTCLQFVERTTEPDYIHIHPGTGCYSYVGCNGGEQVLSLGRGCLYEGTVVHELLHAAGLHHAHTRPDRDEHLDILWTNIDPDYIDHFEKQDLPAEELPVPFDTHSVMLYPADAFVRRAGLTTIKAKDGSPLPQLYNKTGLSDIDILTVGILYNCSRRWRPKLVPHEL
ncbi:astacin-like metalloprotease toxin 5 [Dermacentor albipictus]|uniref:astacin-like metalloprotease toxin 5 n=1 Tax=Dermacentor albipictus TaxID=60249 RepID=UPI0031FC340D